jgi:hypothetical protein
VSEDNGQAASAGVDWAPFDAYPPDDCTCINGHDFPTHGKLLMLRGLVARRPCPTCGVFWLRALRGGSERWEVRR